MLRPGETGCLRVLILALAAPGGISDLYSYLQPPFHRFAFLIQLQGSISSSLWTKSGQLSTFYIFKWLEKIKRKKYAFLIFENYIECQILVSINKVLLECSQDLFVYALITELSYNRDYMACRKLKIFILCSFPENVCWPLTWHTEWILELNGNG